mmetsp:Transcript_6306/g.8911  ORF Transcript_6306/g.8911 Transcript_6306/m.8911 type:complete len:83 (+) Transcript_6306:1054-1302(+)
MLHTAQLLVLPNNNFTIDLSMCPTSKYSYYVEKGGNSSKYRSCFLKVWLKIFQESRGMCNHCLDQFLLSMKVFLHLSTSSIC